MPNLLATFKNKTDLQLPKSISNTGMDTNINDSFSSGKYESYAALSEVSSRIKDSTPGPSPTGGNGA
jgi:hypothetical protein